MSDGDIRFVHIKSAFSRVCRIELPWPNAAVSVTHNGKNTDFTLNGNILAFDAEQDGEYLITRSEYPLDCYYRENVAYTENTSPKEWRNNTIGQFSFTKGKVKHKTPLESD